MCIENDTCCRDKTGHCCEGCGDYDGSCAPEAPPEWNPETTPHAPVTGDLSVLNAFTHAGLNDAERVLAMPGTKPRGVMGHHIVGWTSLTVGEGKTGCRSAVFVAVCDECGAAAMVQCALNHHHVEFHGGAFMGRCEWSQ